MPCRAPRCALPRRPHPPPPRSVSLPQAAKEAAKAEEKAAKEAAKATEKEAKEAEKAAAKEAKAAAKEAAKAAAAKEEKVKVIKMTKAPKPAVDAVRLYSKANYMRKAEEIVAEQTAAQEAGTDVPPNAGTEVSTQDLHAAFLVLTRPRCFTRPVLSHVRNSHESPALARALISTSC